MQQQDSCHSLQLGNNRPSLSCGSVGSLPLATTSTIGEGAVDHQIDSRHCLSSGAAPYVAEDMALELERTGDTTPGKAPLHFLNCNDFHQSWVCMAQLKWRQLNVDSIYKRLLCLAGHHAILL